MELKKKTFADYHLEEKKWGHEVWIVNNDFYCGKNLFFRKNGQTSFHFHMNKFETMYVKSGSFRICMYDPQDGEYYTVDLELGDSLDIPQGQVHSILAREVAEDGFAVLTEFSTYHENTDSYRIGESMAGNE